ncbi:MAG TPA: hypothetical protein VGD42_15870 [Lysobacter sp.]
MTQHAAFLLPLSLALCACTGSVATRTLPAEATLSPGQRMALPDRAWLEYLGTYDDSRCPPDVQCIHAGDARVVLRIGDADAARDLALEASKQGQPRQVGRWRVTLLQLPHGAAPRATLRIDAAR